MTKYEITIELPNGDWVWTRCEVSDFHTLITHALDYALSRGGRVHHVEKLGANPPTGWTTEVS